MRVLVSVAHASGCPPRRRRVQGDVDSLHGLEKGRVAERQWEAIGRGVALMANTAMLHADEPLGMRGEIV